MPEKEIKIRPALDAERIAQPIRTFGEVIRQLRLTELAGVR